MLEIVHPAHQLVRSFYSKKRRRVREHLRVRHRVRTIDYKKRKQATQLRKRESLAKATSGPERKGNIGNGTSILSVRR